MLKVGMPEYQPARHSLANQQANGCNSEAEKENEIYRGMGTAARNGKKVGREYTATIRCKDIPKLS